MKRPIYLLGRFAFCLRRRTPPKVPRTILVLKPGALGDVLMTTPFLRALRSCYPQSRIVYAVGRWSSDVLAHNPHIDQMIVFDDAAVFQIRPRQLLRLLIRLRRLHADLGFVLDKHYRASVFAWLAGVRFRVGFDRRGEGFANNLSVPFGPVRHDVEFNLDLLRVLGHAVQGGSLESYEDDADRAFAEGFLKEHELSGVPLFGVVAGGAENPGQVAYLKRWPQHRYKELLRLIAEQMPQVRVLLFGGPKDAALNAALCTASTTAINVAGRATIRQSIALMRHCCVFITHDTGPMHMAAAAGIPVVTISGPVHPLRHTPQGPQHTFLWKPNLPGALWYDDAGKFPAARSALPCLEAITAAEVLAAAARHRDKHASFHATFSTPHQ